MVCGFIPNRVVKKQWQLTICFYVLFIDVYSGSNFDRWLPVTIDVDQVIGSPVSLLLNGPHGYIHAPEAGIYKSSQYFKVNYHFAVSNLFFAESLYNLGEGLNL